MTHNASIIIVTYNSASTISTCLRSVAKTLCSHDEVLLIDNNSRDNTLGIIQQSGLLDLENIHLLPQSKNLGFPRGCNVGIGQSNKEFVILLNPDTEVFGDWISRLTSHFSLYENTGAVGPLSNYTIPSQHILTYFPGYNNYLQNAEGLISALDEQYRKRSVPSKLLIGFCMVLRRDLLQQYGALDADLFLGNDDIEMSWRLRRNGFQIRVALDVFVNHTGQVSFNTISESKGDRYIQEGTDILYEKMKAFYSPEKAPHPKDYFGVGWWKPSVLDQQPESELFAPLLQEQDYRNIFIEVKKMLAEKDFAATIGLLKDASEIYVNDANVWYTLGSIYLLGEEFENAKSALKNAWSLEFCEGKAKKKLVSLLKQTKQADEAFEFFGAVQA